MKQMEFENGISVFWKFPLISGIISLGLGIWTLCMPSSAITAMAYIFAACILLDGIVNCCYAFYSSRYTPGWGWSLAAGLIGLLCGIWLLCMPAASLATAFVFVMGFFLIVAAINSLCEAFTLSYVSGWWMIWSFILLIATIVLAGVFLFNPIAGGVIVWMWLGLSLILYGIFRITLACIIRSVSKA